MVALNIDGLISGLDTTSIVSQLMQLERQPQIRLAARRDEINKGADLYRQLNTRFQAIETAAEALNSALDWNVTKATSSHEDLATVSATSGAAVSTFAFRVTALAAAHVLVSNGTASDPAQTNQYTSFTVNGVSFTNADLGDRSLNAVASAINASTAGVTATVVQVGVDAYRLQLAANSTGAASAFTVTGNGLNGIGKVDRIATQGTDASITVGTTNPYTITSATNTISNVISGVTLNLKSAGSPTTTVTATVAPDPSAIADKLAALVTAVNDANSLIRTNSTYDPVAKKAGLLLSDQNAAALSNSLIQATTNGVAGGAYAPAAVGISVNRSGVLSFDKAKFLAAYDANPTGVRQMFEANGTDAADDGIVERLRAATAAATDSATGRIQVALDSRAASVKALETQIANWDTRLALRETALKRQFSALESALGRAQSQGSWLAGQLAGLNASNGSS